MKLYEIKNKKKKVKKVLSSNEMIVTANTIGPS